MAVRINMKLPSSSATQAGPSSSMPSPISFSSHRSSLPPVSSPQSTSTASTSTITRTLLVAASGYCAAWGVYYLVQDTLRRSTVRRRRKRHHKRVVGASGIDSSERPKYEVNLAPTSPASAEEKAAIEERFASTSILGRYTNPFPEWREQGAWEFVVWKTAFMLTKGRLWSDGGIAKDRKSVEGRQRIARRLTLATPDWSQHGPPQAAQKDETDSWHVLTDSEVVPSGVGSPRGGDSAVKYTWIGQSTFVITTRSLNILTDPVFGVQPIASFFSPTRLNRTLPATLETILEHVDIDVVIVSHNHFDHFDTAVVPLLPEKTMWIVPKGMRKLLERSGAKSTQIVELDWWQEEQLVFKPGGVITGSIGDLPFTTEHRRLQVRALPAMHWSSRNGLDTNQSLWCSYSLEISSGGAVGKSSSSKIYFSGDTGYSPSLARAIGHHSGPFDLAFLPIGSFEPRWHMKPQHVSARDSVAIAMDIKTKRAVGMHWATWVMSDEHWEAPALELEETVARVSPAGKDDQPWFSTMSLGETRIQPIN